MPACSRLIRLAAHARALQSLIEKVTIFKSASAYVDPALTIQASADPGASEYRLAALYDRYHEYAELLAGQGLTGLAVKYAAMTPAGYTKAGEGVGARERLQVLAGQTITGACSGNSRERGRRADIFFVRFVSLQLQLSNNSSNNNIGSRLRRTSQLQCRSSSSSHKQQLAHRRTTLRPFSQCSLSSSNNSSSSSPYTMTHIVPPTSLSSSSNHTASSSRTTRNSTTRMRLLVTVRRTATTLVNSCLSLRRQSLAHRSSATLTMALVEPRKLLLPLRRKRRGPWVDGT